MHELVKRKFRPDRRKEKGESWKASGWKELDLGQNMGHFDNMEQDTCCIIAVFPKAQMSKFTVFQCGKHFLLVIKGDF